FFDRGVGPDVRCVTRHWVASRTVIHALGDSEVTAGPKGCTGSAPACSEALPAFPQGPYRHSPGRPRVIVMRVHVVSDVHGNTADLARAGDGADALICLGDLVLFLDYADHSRGIFPELFGEENADRLVELRTARRFEEARELGARLWSGVGGDRAALIEKAVRKQYAEMFAAFPTPTY